MRPGYRYLLLTWLLAIGYPLLAQTPPGGFVSTTVSNQWDEAVGLTFDKSGTSMFVWERPGRVWVVENGQRQLLLDISPEVGAWHDHGLLGFALHPQFDTNGYIYLLYMVDRHYLMNFGTPAYNAATNDYFSATIGRLTRYQATRTASGYAVVAGSRTILMGATKSTGLATLSYTHGVGSLVFGTDGTLLVSTGDGADPDPDMGSAAPSYYAQALADGIIRPQENVGSLRSQLVNCLNGKVLRIDPLTGAGIRSNPFYDVNNPNAPRSKVWALGLRNPFRMSLRPGTGSTDPTVGNPGTLYLGDVGYATWEEVDVVDRAGLNLGWPLYEGLTPHDAFISTTTANQDAPNPLYNTGGCTRRYFDFQDLVKQATPTGTATFTNPCNTSQAIPASIPTFVHIRPLIDWKHGTGPSRTGTFSGSTATTINIGAAGSPVSGPQFGGSTSVGGVFYPYNDFPAGYQNTYFFGDYTDGWVRNMTVTSANKPTTVRNFINTGAVAVGMAVNPTSPGLYYVNFPDEIRKVTYSTGNNPPTAVATANKQYGPAPLSIQFTGSASSDPEGQMLSYSWNFGDGATSTQANPTHVFSPTSGAPIGYTITLTVADPQGATGQATLKASANNTPPQVTITSPVNNSLYPLTGQTTYNLRATVTDLEHSASQLSYAWQTFLHHETHEHPDAIDTAPQTTTILEPLGCDVETYYYRIELTVTDAAGLSTKQQVRLNPDCSTASAYTFYRAINLNGGATTIDGNAWAGSGTAANFATNGTGFVDNTVALLPATDAARTGMIRSSVYGYGLSATVSAVPAGTYRVYAYVWEDNYPETFSVALNGQTVLATYNSGPAGTWQKLGPYPVTLAATGPIQLTTTGGAANLSGLELWKQTAGTPTGNQPPVLAAIGSKTATVGQALAFTASASDPDAGQTLSYALVGAPAGATINPSTGAFSWTPTAAQVGANTVTVRVSDTGSPVLTAEETIAVTVSAASGGTYAFYRAVNLNGPALTLDGNAWAGTPAANFSTNGSGFVNNTVALLPATDAARTGMIRASVYSYALSAAFAAVPAGSYQLYAYVWEDNFPETFSLAVNGQPVLANYNSGPAGTWKRLGPYAVTLAATGTVQLTTSGGAANLSGLELWKQSGTVANQPPVANAGPDKALTLPTNSVALPGAGTDPDGAVVGYTWTQVSGPNTASLSGAGTATLTASGLVAGSYVFSLVVTDDLGAASAADQVTVLVNPAPPGGTFAFYRAINLNGPAITLDGNAWAGSTAANYATNGTGFVDNTVALLPATDAARTGMIRSSVYGYGLSATVSAVPAGTYRVYAYVWEDNYPETFSVALNGQTVLATYNSGPAGTWQKLGPYPVTLAATGPIQLTTTGGAANFSGVELWQQTAANRVAAASAPQAPGDEPLPVQLYPNPSPDGRFKLRLPAAFQQGVSYTLLSVLGSKLAAGKLTPEEAAAVVELNLSRQMPTTGVYYLHLQSSKQSVYLKLLRE